MQESALSVLGLFHCCLPPKELPLSFSKSALGRGNGIKTKVLEVKNVNCCSEVWRGGWEVCSGLWIRP